jgi:FKBP-type peptidyl-prolyl cis-trans isomerase FklB
MTKQILVIVLLLMFVVACDQNSNSEVTNTIEIPGKDEVEKPKDFKQKKSFALGLDMGAKFLRDSLDLDFKYFIAGIKYAMVQDSTMMNPQEFKETMDEFYAKMQERQMKMQERMQEDIKKQAAENINLSKEFLAENLKNEGVKQTESGLQYKVLETGTGKQAKEGDQIKVDIIGKLTDGTEFENTYKRGTVIIDSKQLIPGWKEAMMMMKEGSRWRIWLPPDLAYGEEGRMPTIPPNSVLEFEIQFHEIVDPEEVERLRKEQEEKKGQRDKKKDPNDPNRMKVNPFPN